MVVIKSMEKPNSCSECRLKDSERGECYATWKKISAWAAKYAESRPDWCPLVEVEPYGPDGMLYKENADG